MTPSSPPATAAKGYNGWCTKGNGPPLPPCTPAFLLLVCSVALPPLIQFYMLFLAWLAPVFTQQFLSLPPLFLLWPPCLLNPSWLFFFFFFTVNLIISLSSTPSILCLFFSPLFLSLLLPVSVFLVLPLICNLWIYPFLLSLYGPSASLRECCLLGLRGVTPGWGISLPYTSVFPFLIHPLTPSLVS